MGRVAIVTGADSGIGKATAVALAETGWDVGFTWYRDEQGGRGTAAEVRGHRRCVEAAYLDLGDPASGAAVIDGLAAALGGVDVLVNNAGITMPRPFLEVTPRDWQHTLDVDLTGAFVCAQAAARRMVAAGRGGRIINVTSVHEHVPKTGAAAYCAAKGGLGMLTKVMALELAGHGITVNAVAPGEIATPMNGLADVDPTTQKRPGVPLGRPGHAREVAAVITYLASDQASYTTGSSYVVDGGMLLMAAEANRLAES